MNDFCDRCGAHGKARFIMQTGDLVFCGHHARKYDQAIVDQGGIFDVEYATDNDPELASV